MTSVNANLAPINAQPLQLQHDASVQGAAFETSKANLQANDAPAQPIATDVQHTDADPDGGGNNGAAGGGQGNAPKATGDASRPTGLANNAPRVENSKAFFLAHPGASPLTRATHFVAFSTTAPLLPVTSRYFTSNGVATKLPLGYRPLDALRTYGRHAGTPDFQSAIKDFHETAHACSPQRALLAMMQDGSSASGQSGFTSKPSIAAMREMNTPQAIESLLQLARGRQAGDATGPLPSFSQAPIQLRSYPSYLPAPQAGGMAGRSAAGQPNILSRLTGTALPSLVRVPDGKPVIPSLGGLRSFFSSRSSLAA